MDGSCRVTVVLLTSARYGVGGTVGAGIYTLIGSGAAAAGPAITVSFVLCAFACFLTRFDLVLITVPFTASCAVCVTLNLRHVSPSPARHTLLLTRRLVSFSRGSLAGTSLSNTVIQRNAVFQSFCCRCG